MEDAYILDTFKDTVKCSICKFYLLKINWKSHKKDHKYSNDGRAV